MRSVFNKILFLTLFSFTVMQTVKAQESESLSVQKVINQLFEGMHKADSAMVANSFHKGAMLQTIAQRNDKTQVQSTAMESFLKAIQQAKPGQLEERIQFNSIQIDGDLAAVWTDYSFYMNGSFSHCGVNAFQLVKINHIWKIQSIIDTRRKENCNYKG